ncbi:C39 family peptidase [Leifsonia sp. NCR5]|uniref:C39 family peptidase n=1 Tax=Leifsonia sp. NCR5 TaxID=1978342 RepID=UPI000A196655|nr:C39 family peptidase [Leifsonia sp. NCR5]
MLGTPEADASEWRTSLVRAETDEGWTGRQWTSNVLAPAWAGDAGADQAVASWNLDPDATAVVELRARTAGERWHPWQTVALWGDIGRRSSAAPGGAAGAASGAPTMETDVLTARSAGSFDAVQLRITLGHEGQGEGREGERAASRDALRLAAVSFSAPDDEGSASAPDAVVGPTEEGTFGAASAVRPLSQRAYPARADLGGGGPAWCSPTSLTMVAAAWGARIPAAGSADVPVGADPRVPWVARAVYDTAYDGTGNWSFNVAAAGALGFDALVTRLSSLRSARTLTDAGIPLVASISFAPGELPGADYDTPGHLLVIRGFDAGGDVLVADPSNPGGDAGLRTYPRRAFDDAWSHSRRTVYLIVPRGHALPPSAEGEW